MLKKLTSLAYGIIPFKTGDLNASPFKLYREAKLKLHFWGENRPLAVRKILVVDDTPDVLRSIMKKVEIKLGVRTLGIEPESEVSIKEQALALVAAEAPDFIFMDGDLGKGADGEKLYGSELVKELRAGGYQGYIAANSNDPVLNWEMTDNGADFSVKKEFTQYDKTKQLCLFLNRVFLIGRYF